MLYATQLCKIKIEDKKLLHIINDSHEYKVLGIFEFPITKQFQPCTKK